MNSTKINVISLGCAKNLVDSEYLLGILTKNNYQIIPQTELADVVVLNTCGFLGSARKEAKQYINKLLKLKQNKNFKFFVIGCLPQLEKENLIKQYPQIDGVFGVSDYYKLPQILKNFNNQQVIKISPKTNFTPSCKLPRVLSTPKSYAYLKIADGCNNRCSYCLIPTIRGSYRERPIEDIVKEAERIVEEGTKELILVSQDTTFYGTKIYKKQLLHKLIKELSKIKDLLWIRILYTHPGHFYDELISEIKENDKVCKYLDIPIQHTSDKILSLMERKVSRSQIFSLIEKLRKEIKDITLRTTIIVGFPNEEKDDFKILLNDIRNLQFDWLGCFMFSTQKNTKAYNLKPKISKEIKKQRFDEVMKLQQKITYIKNKQRIGKIFSVLVDSNNWGHTYFQCPEVDGETYFLQKPKTLLEKVKIEEVQDVYDLIGSL